jgi:hypothetical protein
MKIKPAVARWIEAVHGNDALISLRPKSALEIIRDAIINLLRLPIFRNRFTLRPNQAGIKTLTAACYVLARRLRNETYHDGNNAKILYNALHATHVLSRAGRHHMKKSNLQVSRIFVQTMFQKNDVEAQVKDDPDSTGKVE